MKNKSWRKIDRVYSSKNTLHTWKQQKEDIWWPNSPMTAKIRVSYPLTSPLALSAGGVCNVLLTHRPWKRWQDTQYVNMNVWLGCMIRLHEITTFVLLGEFLRGRHVEKITHQETAGANPRPSVWQRTKNWMLSTTSELRGGFVPSWTSDDTSIRANTLMAVLRDANAQDPKPCLDS